MFLIVTTKLYGLPVIVNQIRVSDDGAQQRANQKSKV